MYFDEDELFVVSTTRSLKSISRVAENVEVVTAEDIELMGAHTIGEVLDRINGVQVQVFGANTFSQSGIRIQSSEPQHVAVFIDGILVSDVSGNRSDFVTPMPVQFIERIEVLKGPASSVWGSSLGGVINIITKATGKAEKPGGTLQASYGERETVDLTAELNGKKDRFGYYLALRGLETDGFNPQNDRSNRSLYTKLSYELFRDTDIQWTFLYNKNYGGVALFKDWGVYDIDAMESFLSSLTLKSAINSEMAAEISLKYSKNNWYYKSYLVDTGELDPWFTPIITYTERYSASAKVEWRHADHSVVAGTDYESGVVKSTAFDEDKLRLNKWALFLNDTIALGKLSIIPGLRLDYADHQDLFVSPSLGVTYDLGHDTLLRAYVARGFNDPTVSQLKGNSSWYEGNPDLKRETVWSYQAGMETGILKFFWTKVSAFDHEIRDGIVYSNSGSPTEVNGSKSRRQGIEVAIKSVPFYNFTLSAGASVIRAKDLDTDEVIKGVPTSTADVSLVYNDKKSFRGILSGHYVHWNEEADMLGQYNSMIFDLNLIKSIINTGAVNLEIFATGHNIFNGSQYWTTPYINARRWIEAGLRMKF
jgi:vitamin B12 transporter